MAAESGMTAADEPLVLNEQHSDECHTRWCQFRNHVWPTDGTEPPEAWDNQQCGQCIYYVPLAGAFSSDWGVCTNPQSKFDRMAMFEHDGCDSFWGAYAWVASYIYYRTLDPNWQPPAVSSVSEGDE